LHIQELSYISKGCTKKQVFGERPLNGDYENINIKLNYLKIYIRIYYIFNIKPILGAPNIGYFFCLLRRKKSSPAHHPGSKEKLTGWLIPWMCRIRCACIPGWG